MLCLIAYFSYLESGKDTRSGKLTADILAAVFGNAASSVWTVGTAAEAGIGVAGQDAAGTARAVRTAADVAGLAAAADKEALLAGATAVVWPTDFGAVARSAGTSEGALCQTPSEKTVHEAASPVIDLAVKTVRGEQWRRIGKRDIWVAGGPRVEQVLR